ncbi:hypothetical protein [Chitinophaga sp. Cy-1792]|uniref:hypothetical protein n=1 Tax=Chitinophaga sp. Cy-1792 TaxID=2608339 RepID=UPI001422310A|nr:hypothetical protein [Chitinophaga sp. Cy-1792]NIG52370.1 hypothetical protein [Chitinophaga sp. Cy-1792]
MDEEKQEEKQEPAPEKPQPPQSEAPQQPGFDVGLFMYFTKIIRTVFVGLFMLTADIFLGLYLGFAEPEASTPGRMIFFYTWLTITMAAYIYYIWKMWRKKENTL